MAATTMHFGPEWMRTKHQPLTRPQQPPSPPPNSQSALSTYSALVSTVPGAENDKHDDVHPFRYTKEELLRIYKESPKGSLGLEVERWEGVVREIGTEPVALREMGEGEKKLFSGPLNSDLRRRQSTDYLSPLNTSSLGTDRPRLNHTPSSATASPLRERYPALKRRDSNADSPTATMQRKQSLSSLQTPTAGSRTAALPSPRTRPSYPSFDGVLNTGDSWSSRRRPSEASLKPGAVTRELSAEAEDKPEANPEDGRNGHSDPARGNNLTKDGKLTDAGNNAMESSDLNGPQQNAIPASVPIPSVAPQDLAAVEWSYKDPAGNIQGPFRADLMQKWYDDGYFTLDLPMKRAHLDSAWMTLEELIKRATIPDKMFLCPLLPSGGPPGLSRRDDSPLQPGLPQSDHQVFSNPYQPSPIRSLRSSTLDSLNGSSLSDSPVSSLGHLGNNSPDSLAFANRLNTGYAGDVNSLAYPNAVDLGSLRQRQVADLVHDSPLRLHSPSYTALLGNHQLGYDNYGYSSFTPVQSSPWGTPSQPYTNYNHNAGFGTNSFGSPSTFNISHHNQSMGGQVNAHFYNGPDALGQQQHPHAQGYFDPTPVVNGILSETNDTILSGQSFSQYQSASPVDVNPEAHTDSDTLGHSQSQDGLHAESPLANTGAAAWDPALDSSTRRLVPFGSNRPTTLNTTVPAAPSQSSPWGQHNHTSATNSTSPSDATQWASGSQGSLEPVWSEPLEDIVPVAMNAPETQPEPSAMVELHLSDEGGVTDSDVAVESVLPDSVPSPSTSKTKTKKAQATPAAVPAIVDTSDATEAPVPFQSPKAPWAKSDKKKGKGSATISLREIQDAEAKLAEARKTEKEKERTRMAAAASAVSDARDDIQPFTASWGLPTSQAGSRVTGIPKETVSQSVSPAPSTPTPAVWTTAAKNPIAKKSMKEIQEEEERRKKTTVNETVTVAPVKRGYADQANKASSVSPAPVATQGSAWVTVGASGKTSSAGSSNARQTPTIISSVSINHATASIKPSSVNPSRPSASVVRPALTPAKVEDFPVSPSHEFLKWLSESLKGLKNGINIEDVISMLLSFSLDPDPSTMELISDAIYDSSTTLDGRRFAKEFVAKRKADATSRPKGANTAKSAMKPISIAEVVKATPRATQPEWGFKVVNKKKKGGRS